VTATSRRRARAGFAVGLVVVLVMLGLAYRPATLFGVEGGALLHSVEGETGGSSLFADGCRSRGDSKWRCGVSFDGGSSGSAYAVDTRRFGCWDARRVEAGPGPTTASGCINGLDVLRPFDRLLD
jgi:hypothetical protein